MSSSEAECTCCVCCGGYAGIISELNSEIYEILLFGSCCDGSLAQDEAQSPAACGHLLGVGLHSSGWHRLSDLLQAWPGAAGELTSSKKSVLGIFLPFWSWKNSRSFWPVKWAIHSTGWLHQAFPGVSWSMSVSTEEFGHWRFGYKM